MENAISFKDLKIGQKGEVTKTISEEDVNMFTKLSLDKNPLHTDEEFASKTQFKGIIVYGMLVSSLIGSVLGTKMPGPGSVCVDQTLRFLRPVYVGDTITAVSELIAKIEERRHVIARTTCYNQNGKIVIEGNALQKIFNP